MSGAPPAAEDAGTGEGARDTGLRVGVLPVTPFQQNCSLLICTRTGRAALVDPGGDLDAIVAAVAEQGATVEKIFLTHGHLDHCGQAGQLAARLAVPIEGPHREDRFWIDRLPESARQFGFPPLETFTPERWLDDGDTVRFGEQVLEVRHCPGHTPGHVVFFHRPSRLAIVGDVLFRGSIGRTDFPRGDHATLIRSIRSRLWPLEDEVGGEVTFIPGHGPLSTFRAERADNPFVGDRVR